MPADPRRRHIADALNGARKYIASRTLDRLDWEGSELLEGDVVEAIGELKLKPGPDLITQGSTELLQTLLTADVIDEFRLWLFPVIAGSGKRLFGSGARPAGLRFGRHGQHAERRDHRNVRTRRRDPPRLDAGEGGDSGVGPAA